MSDGGELLTCPECGEWLGGSTTYCMHCASDLSEYVEASEAAPESAPEGDGEAAPDADEAGADAGTDSGSGEGGGADAASRDGAGADSTQGEGGGADGAGGAGAGPKRGVPDAVTAESAAARYESTELLDPDGFADNALTVVAGIVAGFFVGAVGTVAFLLLTGSGYGFLLGVLAWIGSTAHLVRRRTVQEAVSHGGYAAAAVLLLVPVAAVGPMVDVEGGLAGRAEAFAVFLAMVAIPAAIAAGIGYWAGKYVPDEEDA